MHALAFHFGSLPVVLDLHFLNIGKELLLFHSKVLRLLRRLLQTRLEPLDFRTHRMDAFVSLKIPSILNASAVSALSSPRVFHTQGSSSYPCKFPHQFRLARWA